MAHSPDASTKRKRATSMNTRMEARRQAMLRRVVVITASLVIVVALVWLIWLSPVFSAKSVEVTGLSTLTPDVVTQTAQVPLGTPLARLDIQAIKERVETIPQVDTVDITRNLNGRVDIHVTERVPIMAVAQSGGYGLVDASGVAYITAPTPPAGVLVAQFTGGDKERMTHDGATIVGALPVSVREQVTSLSAASPDSFTLQLTSGATVMWGSAEQSDLKSRVLDPLLKVQATYYDVSSPAHPATR